MPYQQNIPQPTDQLSQSQADLLNNFQAIKTLVDVNHVTFDTADQGKHKWVTFPVQVGAPAFGGGEEGLYNRAYATSGQNELFVHKQSLAGTADIPMTASILGVATPVSGAAGWTYLPSGILMHWYNVTGNGTATVTVDVTYPAFTQILSVLASPIDPGAGDVDLAVRVVNIISNTQFSLYFSTRIALGATAGNAKVLVIGY